MVGTDVKEMSSEVVQSILRRNTLSRIDRRERNLGTSLKTKDCKMLKFLVPHSTLPRPITLPLGYGNVNEDGRRKTSP